MKITLIVIGCIIVLSAIIGFFELKNAPIYDEDENRFIPKSEESDYLKKQRDKYEKNTQ